MFDELWSEIADAPGEIFDVIEYKEEWEKDEKELYDEIIGSFWEAVDGDDLVEEITAATGWCIKSIDYRHILN